MSNLYTPDGQIRQDIRTRETTGGGKLTYSVNSWVGESNGAYPVTSKEEANRNAFKSNSNTNNIVAGKSTDWDNSGEVRFSQKRGKDNRIKQISGNDIFADVPSPRISRPTSGLKSRDLYGSSHSFDARENGANGAQAFGTSAGAKFSPGYRGRTVTESKKRDLAGHGSIWFNDNAGTPPPRGSLNGIDPPPRPVRASSGRVTGGGAVSVKLG